MRPIQVSSPLLTTPCYKSDGSFGAKLILHDESHGLETCEESTRIIIGASL